MKKQLIHFQLAGFILFVLFTCNLVAQDYVGSQRCAPCHSGVHTDWKSSGHPYKLQRISDGNPPAYPEGLSSRRQVGPDVDYTIQPGVPRPPAGYTWDQVGWVLGGFNPKARFIDVEGYVVIGAEMQYNVATSRWVRYDQDDPGRKPYSYSCFRCHTTGPSQESTPEFDAYPGIQGSWAETGVGCEACHGPGSDHVANPTTEIPPKEGYDTCNSCHARDRSDTNTRVEWRPRTVGTVATGFIRHREQGDMMEASKHFGANMTCASCHNPHKSVYYELGGIKTTPNCQTCHPAKEIPGHTAASCTDCHMPPAARSGESFSPYVSDQSGHFWRIITDASTMFDNLDEDFIEGKKFINVDEDGLSGLTLDYTCLQCHVGQDVAWAAQFAKGIHETGVSSVRVSGIPTAFGLDQNYPNPFNPSTTITYLVPVRSSIRIELLDASGRLVKTLVDETREAGRHSIVLNADQLNSGVYFYRMTAPGSGPLLTKKMVLVK